MIKTPQKVLFSKFYVFLADFTPSPKLLLFSSGTRPSAGIGKRFCELTQTPVAAANANLFQAGRSE